jgi:hypothetical protein
LEVIVQVSQKNYFITTIGFTVDCFRTARKATNLSPTSFRTLRAERKELAETFETQAYAMNMLQIIGTFSQLQNAEACVCQVSAEEQANTQEPKLESSVSVATNQITVCNKAGNHACKTS